MWSLTRDGKEFGYHARTKEDIIKAKKWYIDDHVKAEAAALQLRLWNETQTKILESEAQEIARETLEDIIGYKEVFNEKL